DGAYPYGALVQCSDGNFYGTTYYGGTSGYGTVFRISSSGSLTTLYSFSYSDGAYPEAALVQGSDGNLYGTTYQGGTSGYGTVFRISSSGSLTTLYSFSYSDGSYPYAGLVQGSDSNFYGTTSQGGASGVGTAFRISPGGNLTTLWSFTGCTDGSYPHAGLVQGSDGNFYGTTPYGGMDDAGTVFLLTAGGSLTTLYSFSYGDGANPYAGLVQGSDSNLYGTTANGGTSGDGTVFRIASGLCGYLFTPNAASFGSTGGSGSVTVTASTTNCAWTASSNSGFITITSGSGGTGSGTVSYTVAADTDTNNFGRSGTMTIAGRTFTVAQASLGCSFTLDSTNASFDAAGGSGSVTVSVSGSDCAWTATSDSDFITITSGGGSGGNGTVNYTVAANTNSFPLTGTMTIAGRTFTVTQGGFGCSALLTVSTSPVGGGTTSGGGTVGCGSNVTVCATPNSCYSFANWTLNGSVVSRLACDSFAVAGDETLVANFATAGLTGSSLTALHSFSYSDGAYPSAGLVQGSDGYLYGTTANGGTDGYGTVFRITSSGSLATLYSFSFSDGAYPKGGLVQGTDGNFYGTTSYAGPSGYGTVFRITAGGTLTTLYSFSYSDGAYPQAGLVQGTDGNFYGTTYQGGPSGVGTVFRISPGGGLTTLWSFTGCTDGSYPHAELVQGSDGNFYGTTQLGGPSGDGAMFRITTNDDLTTLWQFCSVQDGSGDCLDGAYPEATLLQGSDGTLYGTTSYGGPSGYGTLFQLILPCTITTSSSPASGGGTTGGGTYDCGSSVMVCATPNACYSFVNWTDQNSNVVSTSACWTVTADGNVSLVANFAPISYTITTSSSPAAGGSTSGGGTVACGSGSNVTVCASANVPYYVFANWTLNGNMVSMSACYTFTPTNSETLVANFALVDSVGDGIPDIWRQSYFGGGGATTNQLSCAACDADGTGQNNLFKYVTGLDPTNPASVFLLQIASATNGLALFFSPLASGRTYTPQVSTDSVSGVWLPLTMFVGPVTNGNQISVTDTCATQPVKFYRIDISLP
ncbi:MAG TPA: choice-of-anchor tandem repeat GloVer-containing protein, partial [Verrucomicrobiae bacterium]|nr:choice-of-anchor tandem repeat GloVer-containing protein [Verrucomicrobiae bacterium]